MVAVLLLKNADLFSPKPMGKNDILCIAGKIAKIGKIDIEHLKQLDIPFDVIDLENTIAAPGIIDPHEHTLGGSGEKGYCSRSPEITVTEIITGGITTVIGCIGVDTYTRNMTSLLGQAKIYNEEGITSFIWSGGYPIPPNTLTDSIKSDLILVNEVIGAGEIAISDVRSSAPTLDELAKVVSQAYIGGILTGKAGVTHFHLGDGKKHLQPLFDLLSEYDIKPTSLYPTHVNRNPELLKQGAQITKLGVTIDFDSCDGDLIPSLKSFIDHEGDLDFLTLSSDASYTSPLTLFSQMREAIKELNWPLEKILPLVTTNTARLLKLYKKGRIGIGADADIIVLDPITLEIVHVIAKGVVFMRESKVCYSPKSLINSNRKIEIYGKKNTQGKLIIIGGREDKENEREILTEVARGVGTGKLCIVSVASSVGDELWESYKEVFKDLGVKKMSHLDVVHRTKNIDEKALRAVKDASAIFFTGGDQLKITSELGGTLVQQKITEIYKKGGIIAGTSAGASVMGETMMISGSSDASFRIGSTLKMAPGLGFASHMLIDQHFAERGRIGRLIGATAHNPINLGIGIDENTAIVLQDRVGFNVIGTGAVYVLDAHEASGCNLSEANENEALSIFNVKLHLLTTGNYFDLILKKPLIKDN